jgi:hypothetical protein
MTDESVVQVVDAAVAKLQTEEPSDVLIFNGPIDHTGYHLVLENTKVTRATTITLLMTTPGGDAGFAFRIARALACRYTKVRLLICGPCKSAGTLIAIGANEIVMHDTAELGPLDVQIRKRDELLQRESGLDIIQSLDHLTHATIDAFRNTFLEIAEKSGLSTRLCADISSNLVTQLYGNIYSQIDPIRLGSVVRANAIAMHYGEMLGSPNLKNGALEQLVLGYPSHDFVIDRDQASQLFQRVRAPTPGEHDLIRAVEVALRIPQFDEHFIVRLDKPAPEATNAEQQQQDNAAPVSDGKAAGSGATPTRGVGKDVSPPSRVAGSDPPATS